MAKYTVFRTVVMSATVEVEAEDGHEARDIARDLPTSAWTLAEPREPQYTSDRVED